MSEWHRDNPELVGTDADPWMIHDSYRKAVRPYVEPEPEVCSSCFGSGVERWDRGLGERCSLCKGRGV